MLRQLKEAVLNNKKILLSDLVSMLDLRTIRNETEFIKKIPEDFYHYFDMLALDNNRGIVKYVFVIDAKEIYKVIPVFVGRRTKAFDFFSEEEALLVKEFIKNLIDLINKNNDSNKVGINNELCLN
jgi:hypothetical protein